VIRAKGLAGDVAIATRSAETLEEARALGLGDSYFTLQCRSGRQGRSGDRVGSGRCIGSRGSGDRPHLKSGAIVTDVGSTKASVVRQMAAAHSGACAFHCRPPDRRHRAKRPEAGFAELFENRWCILTPQPDAMTGCDRTASQPSGKPAARRWRRWIPIIMTGCWRSCRTLPHIIAYNIVGTADDLEAVTKSEVIKYSASGFRDFTRLAASDPVMWRDVCLHNKDALLEMLARFSEDLSSLQRAIRWGDGDKLFEMFTRTRGIRRSIIEAGQDTDAPNFGRNAPKTDAAE
jgi:cyclohexadieny/prephenate dehydrogenase